MASEPIRLGPFVGGLNTFSDPTAIGDTELAVCDNFDLDIDGSLVSRPPISDLAVSLPGGGTMKPLGFYTNSSGASFLIASGTDGTYYFTGTAWVLITSTFSAAAMAQYRDNAWLVAPPSSANPGGKWNGSTFTAVATMPKGATIAVQKERLWIGPGRNVTTNGSRIYFCPASDPDTWNGDFISVSTGDGQNVLEIMVYFQDLLIFKNDSTYRYNFTTDPALGTISRVSDTVGTLNTGCVTTFENRVFVLHDNNMFELSNYNYERLNDKVPFKRSTTPGSYALEAGVSYFSNRLFVSFYGNTYVWSVKTRAWTTWSSSVLGAMGRVYSIPDQQAVDPMAYTHSALTGANGLYSITDVVTTATEDMTCTIVTKNYDYQTASSFKRLFMWGVDCIARDDVTGTVTPVQYSSQITWGQAKLRTWGTAKQFTWGRGANVSYTKTDPVGIQGTTGERKFLKLGPISLRFRQVGFTIEMKTDGGILTAPARLFNLQTWVKEAQGVVKRIS